MTINQIGSSIDDGLSGTNQFGYSVSLNNDGTKIAIAAPYLDASGIIDAGQVRVYQYSSGWSQLGSSINGTIGYEKLGFSLSLSDNGEIVAMGAPGYDNSPYCNGKVKVYQYSSESWSQLGSNITSGQTNDLSGYAVSLSSDGSIVAIGAPQYSSNLGQVQVYQYSSASDSWSQLGSNIDGETTGDKSGSSVSLSSDGTIVAIGAPYNNGNGDNSGNVRVYQYISGWSQLGADINGAAEGDLSGRSVSLSSDGTIVAIGAPLHDSSKGQARVYEYSSGSWLQLGTDIDGEAAGDKFGFSVSLNSSGTIVAIGAPYWSGGSYNYGYTKVYLYDNGSWSECESNNTFRGGSPEEKLGYSVSLDGSGHTLAIGGPGNLTNNGIVNVWNIANIVCLYGFVNIMTNQGLKLIQDLKRGYLILTNDGYQPLSKLIKSRNINKVRELMVKIPKDYFCQNIPSEDIYTTHSHPLSVKILSDKDDVDFEYLHFYVKELMNLNYGVELCYLEKEDYIYNLVFDKHYELNIGGLKFLSHHPNHNNGNYRLHESDEFNHQNRSKKVYADKDSKYFQKIKLKELLKGKPSEMEDKEFLAKILKF